MARNYAKEIDSVKNDVGELRSDIEKLVKLLSDEATSKSQQAMNAAKEGVAVTERKNKENTFTSVAATFGVGLVLGRIMSK